MAAMKIDKISRRYLTVSDGIAPHQFAFCLFVAGQVLLCMLFLGLWLERGSLLTFVLAHALHHAVRAPDEVSSIISSLNEVSKRLMPDATSDYECLETPASRFAKVLASQRDLESFPDRVEESISRFQQVPAFTGYNNASSTSNIHGVLYHDETSPSSGVSPGNYIPFSYENLMGTPQSLLSGTHIGTWPLSISDTGRGTGCDENDMALGSG